MNVFVSSWQAAICHQVICYCGWEEVFAMQASGTASFQTVAARFCQYSKDIAVGTKYLVEQCSCERGELSEQVKYLRFKKKNSPENVGLDKYEKTPPP